MSNQHMRHPGGGPAVTHLPCGCRTTEPPSRRVWFYRPEWSWDWGWILRWGWVPVGRGGDEWCRWTIWFGFPFTGKTVVALWGCRGCEDCGPNVLDGVVTQ
jgi:hypothetical protein